MAKGTKGTEASRQTVSLRFRKVNRDIFFAIKRGRKRIETRAATVKYRNIRADDTINFICGRARFQKHVKKISHFPSISALLRRYRPEEISPRIRSARELQARYASFPRYTEKIRRHGLIAIGLR